MNHFWIRAVPSMMKLQLNPMQEASAVSPLVARERAFLERISPVVKTILSQKSGMDLDAEDLHSDNLDAVELYHDVIAKVWERMLWAGSGVGAIEDLRAYAASVTHNAWSDYLRHKYPNRTSLKNRLIYFLKHEPGFLIWSDLKGDRVAAIGDSLSEVMSQRRISSDDSSLARFKQGIDRPPIDSMLGRPFYTLHASDWRKLLSAIFLRFRAPLALDDLMAICVAFLDVRESLTASIDENSCPLESRAASESNEPHNVAQTRSMLRRLWALVQQLPEHYRLAYLLNIPGPGKTRGDIEVLLLDGVATLDQIEASLGLSDCAYRMLGAELGGVEPSATTPVYPGGPSERFVQFWDHLPLSDALIARLIGLQPQQVINRRMLALRQLARGFGLNRRAERVRK